MSEVNKSDVVLFVNEIFGPTIQGEGTNIGKPCLFIRLSGCDFKCVWCDTYHDSYTGMSTNTILDVLDNLGKGTLKHVVLTGGNPLKDANCVTLVENLMAAGYTVEIETQGSIVREFPKGVKLTISPKGPSAGNTAFADIEVYYSKILDLVQRHQNVTLKLMSDGREDDIENAKAIMEAIVENNLENNIEHVIINAVNTVEEVDMIAYKDNCTAFASLEIVPDSLKSKVRILTQLHKIVWPNQAGV